MSYQNNIPGANDELSQSQTDIQGNFAAIETLITIDHVDFNIVNSGMHKAIHFVSQAAAPTAPITTAAMVSLYCGQSMTNNLTYALYFKNQNSPNTTDGLDFTSSIKNMAVAPTDNSSGWAVLPSGIIQKWGFATVNPNSMSAAIPFATGANVPTFAYPPAITVSLSGMSGMDKALFVNAVTTSTVTVYNANANGGDNRTFYYFAIGV